MLYQMQKTRGLYLHTCSRVFKTREGENQPVSFIHSKVKSTLDLYSAVWLNIKGRQDFRYKTPIILFYSENNSDSLNRPPNINLIVVQCTMGKFVFGGRFKESELFSE